MALCCACLYRRVVAYIGKLATGGFKGLPVVHPYVAKGSVELLQSASAQDLLVELGVREHVDAKFLFEEFNEGRLLWNRQEILHYLAGMRKQLKSDELKYLADMNFLPRADFSSKGIATPSTQSFAARQLYVPSEALYNMELGLPFVYTPVSNTCRVVIVDEEDSTKPKAETQTQADSGGKTKSGKPEAQAEDFFKVKLSADVLTLLDALGVHRKPQCKHLLDGARAGNSRCLSYLLQEWSSYKADFTKLGGRNLPILPVLGITDLRSPKSCFSNARAALLRLPVVDPSVVSSENAKRLGVREHPNESECLWYIQNAPPAKEEAEAAFAYLAMLLPYWTDRTLRQLQSARFIPIRTGGEDSAGVGSNEVVHVRPCDVFLKTPGEESHAERFGSLFRFVEYSSAEARRFLQICGVRAEPSPSELALEIATDGNAARYVEQHGHEQYLHLLRFLSVEFASINARSRAKLRSSACLLAFRADEKQKKEHVLTRASRCYIADNSVLKRLFNPLCAPPETQLERMYQALGAPTLGSAVKTKVVYDNTPVTNSTTRDLLRLLVARVPLMTMQRERGDLSERSEKWLRRLARARDGEDEGMVLQVPLIKRVMVLDEERKERGTTAFCMNEAVLLITKDFDFFDIAEELVRVFLDKVDMNDSLLWATILQSSTESLIAK